jgi:fatty acid/phospholipid biosynthesis enzyme
MKIAIDAMGGDLAPKAAIFGSLEAIKTSTEPLEIILLGDELIMLV